MVLNGCNASRLAMASAFGYVVFGLTVHSVLTSPEFSGIVRNLDCVELWSGAGTVWGAAKDLGLRSQGFDKNRPGATNEDILMEAGFRHALHLVLGLRPGALLWMAPVCSSWIFLNFVNTHRGQNIWGNPNSRPVIEGNAMAISAAFLWLVAWCMNQRWRIRCRVLFSCFHQFSLLQPSQGTSQVCQPVVLGAMSPSAHAI